MEKFRLLRENEIEWSRCHRERQWTITLLYKDARCDMNILMKQLALRTGRSQQRQRKLHCKYIWDDNKNMWISKE